MLKVGNIEIMDVQKVNMNSPEFYKDETLVKFSKDGLNIASIEPFIPELDVIMVDEEGNQYTETIFAKQDETMVKSIEELTGKKIKTDDELLSFLDEECSLERDISDFTVLFDDEEFVLDSFIDTHLEYCKDVDITTLAGKVLAVANILNMIA